MNKILYISHHRQSSGWGRVCREYANCLDSLGYNIVCRPLILNEQTVKLSPRLQELEQKSDKDCDIIIQHCLPHLMQYDGHFKKNIAIYYSECNQICQEWASRLNLMDEIWCCNSSMIQALQNSYVTTPCKLVRPPVDVSRYERTYKKNYALKHQLEGSYSFLFVGELSKRKNLSTVLRAFHSEFKYENVELVIKTNKFGLNSEQVKQAVQQLSNEVKTGLKLYPNLNDYKSEIIISEHLSDTGICELHNTVDCVVAPSFGEAYAQVIIDGLGFGNIVIGSEVGGPADYLDGLNQYESGGEYWSDWKEHANSLVVYKHNMVEEPCFGMVDGFNFLFTSDESWYNPSISELRKLMRTAYEMDDDTKKILRKNALNTVYDFSYENFVEAVKEIL